MTGGTSWPARGLASNVNNPQHADGRYDEEGLSWTLLRNSIQEWAQLHDFQARHILAHMNGHVLPAQQVYAVSFVCQLATSASCRRC